MKNRNQSPLIRRVNDQLERDTWKDYALGAIFAAAAGAGLALIWINAKGWTL